jgi:serine/threonine protein kinase/Ca2+-binding EF-hand superfamily protein
MITQYDIFDHLLKTLKQKNLTLEEMFDQIDLDKNQYIEVDEFHQVLECMGFMITEQQVFEVLRQMDENFDGKVSYNELRDYILRLGFDIDKTLETKGGSNNSQSSSSFTWRDKGLELIIQSLQKCLNGMPYEKYFDGFDNDHDGSLTPAEFRMAMLNLKEAQLSRPQIERILHILLEERKSHPLVSIARASKFLRSYSAFDANSGKQGSGTLLIDEDLFVYIVERYDGFSRLVDQFQAVEERSQYISRHTHEINLRGLDMLANQLNLEKLHRRAKDVNEIYDSSLILLANEANRMIRDEAQMCVLDPSHSINTIVNDDNRGALNAVSVPMVENSNFDIDLSNIDYLPSGAMRYEGVMISNKKKVEVLCYPNDYLNFVSADGKVYKRHLQNELQIHRFLMGATYDDEEDLDPETMDIFQNIGKFEKKIGLAANDKEIYVINEKVDEDEWISLEDFVFKNGGILNIPMFYHTNAPLFIIRYWAKMILKIIQKVHDVSAVLRCLQLNQIYVSRDGKRIKLSHCRGAGLVNNFGYIASCPDIYLSLDSDDGYKPAQSQTTNQQPKVGGAKSSQKTDGVRHFSNSALDNPFIAPETLYVKFLDQSSALDVWSFGMIMYCLLLGKKPKSFYNVFRNWSKRNFGSDIEVAQLPFTPPSSSNFLYDPFAVDFDSPFDAEDEIFRSPELLDIQGSLKEKGGNMNFENFIKCLKDMSYSALFTQENSKKFYFQTIQ